MNPMRRAAVSHRRKTIGDLYQNLTLQAGAEFMFLAGAGLKQELRAGCYFHIVFT